MKNKGLMSAASLIPLAIGLVSMNAPTSRVFLESRASSSVACAEDLESCPETGCADPDTDHALLNQTKRSIPQGDTPKSLSFDDFQRLQSQATAKVGEKVELDEAGRAKLRGLKMGGGRVSEGDLVQVAGFLVGDPHANTKESVNCNLTRQPNNDFHIPLASDPQEDDVDGIVVEMIPQGRPAEWTLPTLRKIRDDQREVLVIGQLFYDNAHKVNTEPGSTGDPRRFSLFEVHPITKFLVCASSSRRCDPKQADQWTMLEKFPK